MSQCQPTFKVVKQANNMSTLYRTLLTALICCGLSTISYAQTPKLAAGLRFGYPWSISVKASPFEGDNAVEGFIGYRRRGSILGGFGWSRVTIGGLYEIHKPLEIDGIDGLQYYFGGGASVLFYSYDDGFFIATESYSRTSFGLLAVGGLNYTFEDAPINLSIDWMPRVYIGGGFDTGIGFGYGALSARYVISR